MAELKIVDEEFESVASTYATQAQKLNEIVEKYCSIMDYITSESLIEGKTAQNIVKFSGLARSSVSGELVRIMQAHNIATKLFIEQTVADDDPSL